MELGGLIAMSICAALAYRLLSLFDCHYKLTSVKAIVFLSVAHVCFGLPMVLAFLNAILKIAPRQQLLWNWINYVN